MALGRRLGCCSNLKSIIKRKILASKHARCKCQTKVHSTSYMEDFRNHGFTIPQPIGHTTSKCNYSSRVFTLAEVSAAATAAFFPSSIWTEIFAWLKSTPELCNARVKVSNNLADSECNDISKFVYPLSTKFLEVMR